jgi:hypothetical protein
MKPLSKHGWWIAFSALFCTVATSPAAAQTVSEQYLLAAANQDRAMHRLLPVRLDSTLVRAAIDHARQMANHGGISHQFAGEQELAERASAAGAKFSRVTENVAEASNAALIHDLWMQSPGHRANLLDPNVDSVGIAVISRNGQLYAVEDFARAVATLSVAQQEAAVAYLLEQAGVSLSADAATQQDARATCRMGTGFAGARKPWFVMRYTAADLDRLPHELASRLSSGKYHIASVGACANSEPSSFTSYNIAVLLYP